MATTKGYAVAVVLVIDDDRAIRSFLRDVLEGDGHTVWEAADGAVGLKFLLSEPPNLVCCDLFMPVREGLETIREIHRLRPDLPVVALSGGARDMPDFLGCAKALGAADALRKPISPRRLLQAGASLLPR